MGPTDEKKTLLGIREQSLSCGASNVGSETLLTELVYRVTVTITMTERADQLHHNNAPAHPIALVHGFLTKHHITWVRQLPLQTRFVSLWLLPFPKANITTEREVICEYDCHTVHKLSRRRLTADWLAPWESDCSQTHGKVSSDWLPSYIEAIQMVLEIFKMERYFPDSAHILLAQFLPAYNSLPEARQTHTKQTSGD